MSKFYYFSLFKVHETFFWGGEVGFFGRADGANDFIDTLLVILEGDAQRL